MCREFQRGMCSRPPNECRYAHPTDNVPIDNNDNLVTVCMDYVKNKCSRDSCRYFHPPAHLQTQIKAAQQRANASSYSSLSNGNSPMVRFLSSNLSLLVGCTLFLGCQCLLIKNKSMNNPSEPKMKMTIFQSTNK